MYFFNQVWSAVVDHFVCYPVISWTFVVLQFVHGFLYFFYQYITLAVSKWWRDVFQHFDKIIGYLFVKLCHVEFAAVRCPSLYYVSCIHEQLLITVSDCSLLWLPFPVNVTDYLVHFPGLIFSIVFIYVLALSFQPFRFVCSNSFSYLVQSICRLQ